MGWKGVERVWLPDWVRDRDEVVARLARAVHEPVSPPTPAFASVLAREPDGGDVARGGPTRSTEPSHLAQQPLRLAAVSADPPPVGAAPVAEGAFRPAADVVVGVREDLDDMAVDARARWLVQEQVHDVIREEGPVEAGRLARLVCRRFGLQRVFAKRAAEISALVPLGQMEETRFGTFVWPTGVEPADYRSFRPAIDTGRNVEEIAPQELLNAMRHLAQVGAGIGRDELVRETALLFGVRRLTAKPRAHLEGVLENGVQLSRLQEHGATIKAGAH